MATTITANGINFPDGSAGSPSIGGTDTNTGLFTGSDIVGFATGGSERLRIDASGNVNIANDSGQLRLGTGADLLVYHNGSDSYVKNSTGDLYIRDTNGNIFIQPKTDENGIKCIADGAVELYYDNSKKLETTSSGATATGHLTVQDTSGDSASSRVYLTSGNTADSSIYFGRANDTATAAIRNDHSDDSLRFYGYNNAERMRIDSSGKVGINTTSPAERLHVYEASGAAVIRLEPGSGNGQAFNILSTYGSAANTGNFSIRNESGSSFLDLQHNEGTPRMQVRNGTANVHAQIDADGIKFNGDTAAANGLDDYEEGTFTPRLGGTSNSGSYYVEGTGSYIKIGRQVTVSIRFNNQSLDNSASGTVNLFNMPFTSSHNPTNGVSGIADNAQYYKISVGSSDWPTWYMPGGSTTWHGLVSRNANTWIDWDISDFESSGIYMNFCATYFTA